jgi:hypothetical protein
MIRTEFPRCEVGGIERVCRSSRERRRSHGLGGRILVVAKLVILCGGYFFAVFGGFFVGIGFSDTAPNLAWLFGIGGIVCAASCAVAMVRVARAAPWLPDDSLIFAWSISISGGVCAVGVGVGVMMLTETTP